jgi:hypothetical protein
MLLYLAQHTTLVYDVLAPCQEAQVAESLDVPAGGPEVLGPCVLGFDLGVGGDDQWSACLTERNKWDAGLGVAKSIDGRGLHVGTFEQFTRDMRRSANAFSRIVEDLGVW